MNNLTVSGNVGRDGETRTVGDFKVFNFPLAFETGPKDKKQTTWVRCALWGDRAESIGKYIKKGDRLVVSGEVRLNPYTTKDGKSGQSLEMNVGQVVFMSAPKTDGTPTGSTSTQQAATAAQGVLGGTVSNESDIPF